MLFWQYISFLHPQKMNTYKTSSRRTGGGFASDFFKDDDTGSEVLVGLLVDACIHQESARVDIADIVTVARRGLKACKANGVIHACRLGQGIGNHCDNARAILLDELPSNEVPVKGRGQAIHLTGMRGVADALMRIDGGAANSQHLDTYATAADIATISGTTPSAMAAYVETLMPNTGGIGIYSWGIHVDVRKTKSRWNG